MLLDSTIVTDGLWHSLSIIRFVNFGVLMHVMLYAIFSCIYWGLLYAGSSGISAELFVGFSDLIVLCRVYILLCDGDSQ